MFAQDKTEKAGMSILLKILSGPAILFLTYALLEAVVAGLDLTTWIEVLTDKAPLTTTYQDRHSFFYILCKPDEHLGFRNSPHLRMKVCYRDFSASIDTDELGFRKGAGDKKKSPVVVIGDSFSWGYGVTIDKSWPELLARTTRQPVANFSVIGGCPFQYHEIMKEYPEFFKRRLILYGLYSNDLSNNMPKNPADYYKDRGLNIYSNPCPTNDDLAKMIKKPFLKRTASYTFWRMLTDKSETKKGFSRNENEVDEEWLERDGWDQLYFTFSEAINLARSYGSKMQVILFPSRISANKQKYRTVYGDTLKVDAEERAYSKIKRFLEDRSISVLDLTWQFRVLCYRGESLFFKGDCHLNEKGNVAASRCIWEFVREGRLSSPIGRCSEEPLKVPDQFAAETGNKSPATASWALSEH